jgi:lipid II:glycine glycyltransferase (peptidoglycan interpeptide bridge formation enzyme)
MSARAAKGKFKYAEIRQRCIAPQVDANWAPGDSYYFHILDLQPTVEELYSHLHKDGVQRKLRRADREHVVLDEGRSSLLLKQFYQLLLLTRRRHRLPPQPFVWFSNLVDCMADRLTIHVARVGDRPIASILTLRHKQTLVYKYGCSDEHFHNLGAVPRLFWQAIQEAKSEHLKEFDLGRSDETNLGLVRFKDHLGATASSMRYWQFPPRASLNAAGLNALRSPLLQNVLLRLPDRLFRLAGEIFYRHAG